MPAKAAGTLQTCQASPLTVSKYKLGVVYQEDGSWQHTRKRRLQDASSLWVLEATAVMQQSADKVRLHGSDLHLRSCMARKCGTRRRRSKTRCQRS
jgi:hypothetical protein